MVWLDDVRRLTYYANSERGPQMVVISITKPNNLEWREWTWVREAAWWPFAYVCLHVFVPVDGSVRISDRASMRTLRLNWHDMQDGGGGERRAPRSRPSPPMVLPPSGWFLLLCSRISRCHLHSLLLLLRLPLYYNRAKAHDALLIVYAAGKSWLIRTSFMGRTSACVASPQRLAFERSWPYIKSSDSRRCLPISFRIESLTDGVLPCVDLYSTWTAWATLNVRRLTLRLASLRIIWISRSRIYNDCLIIIGDEFSRIDRDKYTTNRQVCAITL